MAFILMYSTINATKVQVSVFSPIPHRRLFFDCRNSWNLTEFNISTQARVLCVCAFLSLIDRTSTTGCQFGTWSAGEEISEENLQGSNYVISIKTTTETTKIRQIKKRETQKGNKYQKG